MNRILQDHVGFLEQRLEQLSGEIVQGSRTPAERTRIEAQIQTAELALAYYRRALELEQQITSS